MHNKKEKKHERNLHSSISYRIWVKSLWVKSIVSESPTADRTWWKSERNTKKQMVVGQRCPIESIKLNCSFLASILTKANIKSEEFIRRCSLPVDFSRRSQEKKENEKKKKIIPLKASSTILHVEVAYHLNKNITTQFPMIATNKIIDLEKSGAKLEYAFSMSSQTPAIIKIRWLQRL